MMNIQEIVDTIKSLPPADQQQIISMVSNGQQVPLKEPPTNRSGFGWAKGLVILAPNFDEPLTEFEDAGK